MKYIWKYFLDLNAKRQTGFGVSPLAYNDILAYFTLYKIEYDDFEIAMIEALDGVALEHFAEKRKAEEKKSKKK